MTRGAEPEVVILGANHFQIGRYQNGGGYRNLELALALRDYGVRVAALCPGPTDLDVPIPIIDQSRMTFDDIAELSDIFIFCLLEDEELVKYLSAHGKTLIYDSYLSPVEQMTYPQVMALANEEEINAYFCAAVRRHNEYNRVAHYYLVGQVSERLLKFGELVNTGMVSVSNYRTLGERVFPIPSISYHRRLLPTIDPASGGNHMVWNGGLWNHYSGVDLIIEAVTRLRRNGRDVTFSFMYGDERNAAHSIIVEKLRQQKIDYIWLGLTDGSRPDIESKQPELARSRAFVLLYESALQLHMFLSMRLREALIFEKPLIVSDIGVHAEFVRRHQIGLTVRNIVDDLENAMVRLLDDPALYDRLVGNIRALRGEYDINRYVMPLVGAIREVQTHGRPTV